MNKFAKQYSGDSSEVLSKKKTNDDNSSSQYNEIKDILMKFQQGYSERNLEKVHSFLEELFLDREDVSILGTATGEIFLGFEKVKELIKGDWEYWGDLNLDYENARISTYGDAAWFSTSGSVKYTFEDTEERDGRYVDFIKKSIDDSELTPKQKITFINWFLTLNYHKRDGNKREYLWPMCLSGILLKNEGKWKIGHLQFSMAKANFPDERFENSKKHIDSYNQQKIIMSEYKNNHITAEIEKFLKSFETEFVEKKDILDELVNKYFSSENTPYIISPENKWYDGIDKIREFFTSSDMSISSLNIEHTIASQMGKFTWVMATGTLKKDFTEEELINRCLEEIGDLSASDLTSKEKLFLVQRSIVYVLKECAAGVNYTCPIRMTAVIQDSGEGAFFNFIHFSFPFYWIFEGKLDGINKNE
jgi:hypothetical protein